MQLGKFLLFLFVFHSIFAEYKSQIGQDKFLNEQIFKNQKNLVFVDIGAHDGITHSNTYFFEKTLNWTGICFEPLELPFLELSKNRNCICINACAWKHNNGIQFFEVKGAPEQLSGIVETYNPKHLARLKLECKRDGGSFQIKFMKSINVNEILESNKIFKIDFVSIDTEGSELEILKTIDFNKFKIHVLAIENPYDVKPIRYFMALLNFKHLAYLGNQDDIFVNNDWVE